MGVNQARAEETRQKLITAAVRLFIERGYVDVLPKDIARAAHLTTGAFYYHFRSKEELVVAMVDEGMPRAAQVIADFCESPHEGLRKFIEMTFAVLAVVNENDLQWIGFHLTQAIGHVSPASRAVYLNRVKGFFELGADLLQSELRDDVSREDAAHLIWITMSGAQQVSDVLDDRGPRVFPRLAMAWRATLRAIARPEAFGELEQFLSRTAARYQAGTSAAHAVLEK